jgi:hypothetical protein
LALAPLEMPEVSAEAAKSSVPSNTTEIAQQSEEIINPVILFTEFPPSSNFAGYSSGVASIACDRRRDAAVPGLPGVGMQSACQSAV